MHKLLPMAALILGLACTSPQTALTTAPDGHDCASAIPVSKIEEEYEYLKRTYPAAKLLGQSLSSCEKFQVDILRIELSDGSQRNVYFNIQKIWDGYLKKFS
jgi:hypothetical protein